MDIFYLAFIFLSFLPSLLWLIFFLREDKNPEPSKMIIKVFIMGMLITFPVIVIYLTINYFLLKLDISILVMKIIMAVFVAAIIEEISKYIVVKKTALESSECDEPVDIMVYAITAALGFAALENVIFLFPSLNLPFCYQGLATLSFFRFISGTFLHALASGVMGYFLAISILNTKKRKLFIFLGIFSAIFLHGLYNFIIIVSEIENSVIMFIPLLLLLILIIVLFFFKRLKKLPSICNPK